MQYTTFSAKLTDLQVKNNSLVCVGLDSDLSRLPAHLQGKKDAQFTFNKAIIDATASLVSCYKPNSAFYESAGEAGIWQLKLTCEYLREQYPEIPIILDAKRADIGSSNGGYVSFAYDYLEVDAITLHPYLGKEALQPFLEKTEKGTIVLCRTSNPGSGELQSLMVDGVPLYQHLAKTVTSDWNKNNNCMLVVGATYPEEIAAVRQIVGDMTLLVPGIGAQGGDLEKTLKAGLNSAGAGLIINSSRGILFASSTEDFPEVAQSETRRLRDAINSYR